VQFLVIARDAPGPDVAARRKRMRESHLASLKKLRSFGQLVMAGALQNEDGETIGSTVVFDFPDRAALDAYLQTEPFVEGKVWDQIEIYPFRVAPV